LFFRQFEELDDLIACDGRVILKKFIDGGSTFDVIQEVLDKHARVLKARRPANPLRINSNYLAELSFLLCRHIFTLRESVAVRK